MTAKRAQVSMTQDDAFWINDAARQMERAIVQLQDVRRRAEDTGNAALVTALTKCTLDAGCAMDALTDLVAKAKIKE